MTPISHGKFIEDMEKKPTETLSTEVTMLSEIISRPLEILFKVGGLTLVFIFIGSLSMLGGYLYNENYLSVWLFTTGASIVFVCLGLFSFSQLYGPIKARRLLKKNKELIDSVQDITIKLTESLSDIQALMFKHTEQVGRILETAAPLLHEIPLLSKVDFYNAQNINRIIVDATDKSQKVINDVRQALITCKVEHLRQYSADLLRIKQSLKEALMNQETIKNKIVNYKEMLDNLRQCLLEYTESIDFVNMQAINYLIKVDSVQVMVRKIPFVGEKLNVRLDQIQSLSNEIREVLTKSEEANNNFRTALNESDVESIMNCIHSLREVNTYFRRLKEPNRNTDIG